MKIDKYTQLRSALINASLYASDFKDEDDGGTCNFDTVVINLPRWQYAKLKEKSKVKIHLHDDEFTVSSVFSI